MIKIIVNYKLLVKNTFKRKKRYSQQRRQCSKRVCIARTGDSRQSQLEILPRVLSTDWQPAAGQGTNHSSRQ